MSRPNILARSKVILLLDIRLFLGGSDGGPKGLNWSSINGHYFKKPPLRH